LKTVREPVRCVVVRSSARHCGEDPCGKLLFTLQGELAALCATGATLQRECPRRKGRLCTIHLDRLGDERYDG